MNVSDISLVQATLADILEHADSARDLINDEYVFQSLDLESSLSDEAQFIRESLGRLFALLGIDDE